MRYGYCHKCPNTKLQNLSSCIGDPEGIRNDQKCPKCLAVYGCTKAHQRMLGKHDLAVLQSERGSLGEIEKKGWDIEYEGKNLIRDFETYYVIVKDKKFLAWQAGMIWSDNFKDALCFEDLKDAEAYQSVVPNTKVIKVQKDTVYRFDLNE